MQAAEAPWIVKSQYPAAVHANVPMVMGLGRRAALHQAQAARHAEMQYQGADVETDEYVLGAPIDTAYGLAAHGLLEVMDDGPAQAPLAYDNVAYAPAQQSRRDAALCRLYFREFGRETARTSST